MKLLLDTHTFIWWDSQPNRIPQSTLEILQDTANEVLLSVASIWEMQIKLQLGKLQLATPLQDVIKSQQQTNAIEMLPIALPHVLALNNLPSLHKDPFDRLLVAQAIVENAVFVSGDAVLSQYPVNLIW